MILKGKTHSFSAFPRGFVRSEGVRGGVQAGAGVRKAGHPAHLVVQPSELVMTYKSDISFNDTRIAAQNIVLKSKTTSKWYVSFVSSQYKTD